MQMRPADLCVWAHGEAVSRKKPAQRGAHTKPARRPPSGSDESALQPVAAVPLGHRHHLPRLAHRWPLAAAQCALHGSEEASTQQGGPRSPGPPLPAPASLLTRAQDRHLHPNAPRRP